MLRVVFLALIFLTVAARGQTTSPAPSMKSSPMPTVNGPVTPSPSPSGSATPSVNEVINSLTPNELEQTISLLKKNFVQPDAINETELSRSTILGLLARLGTGAILLKDKNAAPPEITASFYSDILQKHVAYLRFGSINTANLQALDKKLAELAADKTIDAAVIDLRASAGTDFEPAAEFARRFAPKGKTLFTLRKQGKDKSFTSDREPAFHGLLLLLTDSETAGGAEAIATALRFYDKALVIGQTTAGRAVEYSDLPLPSGKILRVAVSEAIGPDGKSLYPGGLKPDVPVEMSLVDKRQIFLTSSEKGMSPFVTENERPHLNEAALMAGTNPELETSEQRRGRPRQGAPHDAILQRALDLVTSLEIYEKR